MADDQPDRMLARANELHDAGLGWHDAHGLAWLEERILLWPEKWGDDLEVLLYGDFDPPDRAIDAVPLGITVFPDKQDDTVISGARCVLRARVHIGDKTVAGLADAARRVNQFLGAYTLVNWGNAGSGWWSWVTHGTGGGVGTSLDHEAMWRAIEGIVALPDEARRHVEAALYWIREPRGLLNEFYRTDSLRVYSSYWNALECLVEAVLTLRPMAKLARPERQSRLDAFIEGLGHAPTLADMEECYRSVVNPGFAGKASHVFNVCFSADADRYMNECFYLLDRRNRLYDIRNAINHGAIDAENPEEIIRVDGRLNQLWMIVWRLFGCLVPFPAPVDRGSSPA